MNGTTVYIKNATAVDGSGFDTVSVPAGATVQLNGTAIYVSSPGCPITQQSGNLMVASGGGADGATRVCYSDTPPNSYSYTFTKGCATTAITLVYETEPL